MIDTTTGMGPGTNVGTGADDSTGTHPKNGQSPATLPRLLYSLLFAVIAWFAFWVVLILAVVQLLAVLLNHRVSEELRRTSLNVIQYLWELLAYVSFVRDEQPFPVGPFPSYAAPQSAPE